MAQQLTRLAGRRLLRIRGLRIDVGPWRRGCGVVLALACTALGSCTTLQHVKTVMLLVHELSKAFPSESVVVRVGEADTVMTIHMVATRFARWGDTLTVPGAAMLVGRFAYQRYSERQRLCSVRIILRSPLVPDPESRRWSTTFVFPVDDLHVVGEVRPISRVEHCKPPNRRLPSSG